MVIADAKLFFGAAHTLGFIACNGSNLDFAAANSAACKSKGNLLTNRNVGCTANDVANLFACVNLEKVELV